jgi:hypothetical protein
MLEQLTWFRFFFSNVVITTVQSDDGEPPYSPPGIMDFVWDKNHNLIYKTTRWWDGLPESDISVTQVHSPLCAACAEAWPAQCSNLLRRHSAFLVR